MYMHSTARVYLLTVIWDWMAALDEKTSPQSAIATWAAGLRGVTKSMRRDRHHFHAFIGLLCQVVAQQLRLAHIFADRLSV